MCSTSAISPSLLVYKILLLLQQLIHESISGLTGHVEINQSFKVIHGAEINIVDLPFSF